VEALPEDYVVIADAAYPATEHLIPMFYGLQRNNPLYDDFNYASAVCRTRIKMSFGLMNTKWAILNRPLKQHLTNVKFIVHAIARLHNFVIKERLLNNESEWDRYRRYYVGYEPTVPNLNGQGPQFPMADVNDPPNIYREIGLSQQRHTMALLVRQCGVHRVDHIVNARENQRRGDGPNQH
jgi:DDE superfamily endonuclease